MRHDEMFADWCFIFVLFLSLLGGSCPVGSVDARSNACCPTSPAFSMVLLSSANVIRCEHNANANCELCLHLAANKAMVGVIDWKRADVAVEMMRPSIMSGPQVLHPRAHPHRHIPARKVASLAELGSFPLCF